MIGGQSLPSHPGSAPGLIWRERNYDNLCATHAQFIGVHFQFDMTTCFGYLSGYLCDFFPQIPQKTTSSKQYDITNSRFLFILCNSGVLMLMFVSPVPGQSAAGVLYNVCQYIHVCGKHYVCVRGVRIPCKFGSCWSLILSTHVCFTY